ncbi:basic salivary proline-rich protein 4-like [Heterocephalus glaber]|uniref:Basic salivary proline-rich protein 4-like n=1 Tax=Heterocephalus glaber TaxID=10181 RepID=A0AAX6RIV4_HETGA|nr:basic salivary proline-rich protein 4-like [Heterocephalus glaber]
MVPAPAAHSRCPIPRAKRPEGAAGARRGGRVPAGPHPGLQGRTVPGAGNAAQGLGWHLGASPPPPIRALRQGPARPRTWAGGMRSPGRLHPRLPPPQHRGLSPWPLSRPSAAWGWGTRDAQPPPLEAGAYVTGSFQRGRRRTERD